MKPLASLLLLTTMCAVPACRERPERPVPAEDHADAAPEPTNRVDINASVRQNLGITFARVESRNVGRTLRIPGRFELLPTARREYRAPTAGKVELLVQQYQSVEAGTPLYRFDSPRWRELQRELTDADAAVKLAEAGADSIAPYKDAHERHHTEIQKAVDLWTHRVSALEQVQAAGGARAENVAQANASLATARADLAETFEKEVDLIAREREATAQLEAASSRQRILLEAAASLVGLSSDELLAANGERPSWQAIGQIEVRALSSGVIDTMHTTSGSFVDSNGPVLTTVRPDQVRFRAHALQSDLGRLQDGLPATVVVPQGGSLRDSAGVAGTLTLAPTADAERRMIELVMTPKSDEPLAPWARAGVSAFLEVVVSGIGRDELAIPLACVARDGTQSIIFRRDPADHNKAVRMDADLGIDDGRWVVIKSGVAEGNEIVLDGVYQLMVATSGSITKGGHFHPDGTFHEGDE
ncbi:MAG: efflux RND transporter periplasmic adaptor subunit [Phycisphaerales bacterium]|nr:efflux RND transporter periplasmic adaptor subunit [Phycisphaerales bacterium]